MNKYLTQNFPASFNSDTSQFLGFFERSMTKDKDTTLNGYLEMIGDYLDRLEVFPTVGYGRRPYPFQWRATSVVFQGSDDAYEGTGKTPLEAVQNLYHAIGKDHEVSNV